MFRAALFDMDGVIFDSERQYSVFWGRMGEKHFPWVKHFEQRIKGMTLTQIYEQYCPGDTELQKRLTEGLNDFEKHMRFDYIPGFESFVMGLKGKGIRTAVVTSSNLDKMSNVYKAHPDFKAQFDAILTSEDFEKSKPDPDCYLKGAQYFGLQPSDCVGFEDSINGLKAVKAANMFCVGLATTNPRKVVAQYADIVITDYKDLDAGKIKL